MIEAQNLLIQMRLADYPNLKQTDRQKWHREVYGMAYSNAPKPEAMGTEELARYLASVIR